MEPFSEAPEGLVACPRYRGIVWDCYRWLRPSDSAFGASLGFILSKLKEKTASRSGEERNAVLRWHNPD